MQKTPILIGLLALVLAGWQARERYSFSSPESTLTVSGTSTLHDWSCDVTKVEGWAESPDPGSVVGAQLRVVVGDIECGKRTMNRKLQEALLADAHPRITFVTREIISDGNGLVARGTLSIAGADHSLEFPVQSEFATGSYRFRGSVTLSLEKMGVDRPSALMGTVKTGDEVTVSFDVKAGS